MIAPSLAVSHSQDLTRAQSVTITPGVTTVIVQKISGSRVQYALRPDGGGTSGTVISDNDNHIVGLNGNTVVANTTPNGIGGADPTIQVRWQS